MSGSINSSLIRSLTPCVSVATRPNFTPSHQSSTPGMTPKVPSSPFTTASASPSLHSTASPSSFKGFVPNAIVDNESINLGSSLSTSASTPARSMFMGDTTGTKTRSGSVTSRFGSPFLSGLPEAVETGSSNTITDSYIAPLTALELDQVLNSGVSWLPPSSAQSQAPLTTSQVLSAIEAKQREVTNLEDAVNSMRVSTVEAKPVVASEVAAEVASEVTAEVAETVQTAVPQIDVEVQVNKELVLGLQKETAVVEAVETQTQAQVREVEEAALWAAAAECEREYFDDAFVRERQARRFANDGRPRTADGKLIKPEGKVYMTNDSISHDSAHVYYKPSDVVHNYDDDRAPQCTVPATNQQVTDAPSNDVSNTAPPAS